MQEVLKQLQQQVEEKEKEIERLDQEREVEHSVLASKRLLGFRVDETGDESDQQADPDATPFRFGDIPDKPFELIMDYLGTKSKLRLAKTHRAIYDRMLVPDPNPLVFKSVALSDFGEPLKDIDEDFDHQKAEVFIDFLDAVKNILKDLYFPTQLLINMTPQLRARFPLVRIERFETLVEKWEALPVLSTRVIPQIATIEVVTLECDNVTMYFGEDDDVEGDDDNAEVEDEVVALDCDYDTMYEEEDNDDEEDDDNAEVEDEVVALDCDYDTMYEEEDNDDEEDDDNAEVEDALHDARSGLLAGVFTAIGANCLNIQRLGFTNWGRTDDYGIGPQAEVALVQLLPLLQALSSIELWATDLTSDCIRSVLALPNIQANLEEFHENQFRPEDVVGLRHCTNLRYVECDVGSNPSNPLHVAESFHGLVKIEHLNVSAYKISADNPGLREIISGQSGGLRRVNLYFSGIDNERDNAVNRILTKHHGIQVLGLRDTRKQLNDTSLTEVGSLSELRALCVDADGVTGSFLRRLSPSTNPDLRVVYIKSGNAVDDATFTEFHQMFGTQVTLIVKTDRICRVPPKWFSGYRFPDHLGESGKIRAAIQLLCPSAVWLFRDGWFCRVLSADDSSATTDSSVGFIEFNCVLL